MHDFPGLLICCIFISPFSQGVQLAYMASGGGGVQEKGGKVQSWAEKGLIKGKIRPGGGRDGSRVCC